MKKIIVIMSAVLIFSGCAGMAQKSGVAMDNSSDAKGMTLANVAVLRSAITIYKGDNGKYPQDLEKDLVPDYISYIPQEEITKSAKVTYSDAEGDMSKIRDAEEYITETGGWLYMPKSGNVYLNIKGRDPEKTPYYYYGNH